MMMVRLDEDSVVLFECNGMNIHFRKKNLVQVPAINI